MIFAGAILHLVVVLLPFVVFGGNVWDPATLAFLVGASALYFGDAVTMRWKPNPSSSRLDVRAHRWAALTGGLVLLLFWICLVERAVVQPAVSWLQFLGAALFYFGVTVRASAVQTLGRRFRTEIDNVDGDLAKDGVYQYVRHPSETGLLAATLGAAVLLQSTLGVALWLAALLPVTLSRLSLEEQALKERFGDAYERYAERVGGLLPSREHFLP